MNIVENRWAWRSIHPLIKKNKKNDKLKNDENVWLVTNDVSFKNWDCTSLAAPINTLLAILIKVFCKKGENYSKEFSFEETFVAAIPC